MKQRLLSEIDICIQNQNFERAAKLRNVFQSLDKFTEKQTVIVDAFINGVVAKCLQIESHWILIIVHFQDGKIIDVVRTKESVDEVDREQLILGIEMEYGTVIEKDSFIFSSWMTMNAKLKKDLELHFDQFISSFIASDARQSDSVVWNVLKWLQTRYNFYWYPLRIECLDISHFSGDRASGWLSSMNWGITNKKWYRRYKIKKATWGDDYGSLREVIIRRFTDVSYLPDLFILDGADKQLEVVKKLFDWWILNIQLLNTVQFASLGKWDARKSWQKIKGEKEKLYVLKNTMIGNESWKHQRVSDEEYPWFMDQMAPPTMTQIHSKWIRSGREIIEYEFQYDEVDRVLLRLRDEAHRFANSYRKKQQSMELTQKKIIK